MEPLVVDVVHFYPKENAQPHNTVKSYMNEQRGSLLRLRFDVLNVDDGKFTSEHVTKTFDIDYLAEVRIQFVQKSIIKPMMVNFSYRKSSLLEPEANNTCPDLNVKSDELKYSAQLVCTEQWTEWINIGERSGKDLTTSSRCTYQLEPFEVRIIASKRKIVTFANLFDDTELTDFQLSTAEGSVSLHKALLAAHSDVFRTMLCHEWKETANASIQVQGVTLQTLKLLKEYIYLYTLPNSIDELRRLLVLASYYLMDNLRLECIKNLTQMVLPENLQSLLEYACANNIPELIFAIIEQTPSEIVHNARLNRKIGKYDDDSEEELEDYNY